MNRFQEIVNKHHEINIQLELSASNTVKVDYRLPVTCSDFNSTTVNSLGLDFIDLLPVTLSISYRCLNVVSNTDFYAICSHYYGTRTIRTLVNSALVNSDPILFGPSQFGL